MGHLRLLFPKLSFPKLHWLGSGGNKANGGETPLSLKERLFTLRQRATTLANKAASFWLTYAVDRECGGFHATLDRCGKTIEPSEKFVVQQARHLWAFSEWYFQRDQAHPVRQICERQYAFLIRNESF
jgi:mannose/cellobiose epimerase-like protein (N-acyl-D-glucosamine 2-epimerase family)